MLDALLLAHMVDAHVTDDAKAKLSNLREHVLELLLGFWTANNFIELLYGIPAKKRFNSCVAKCDIDEGFEEVDQVLGLWILDVLRLRVADERKDHELGDATFDETLAAILVY